MKKLQPKDLHDILLDEQIDSLIEKESQKESPYHLQIFTALVIGLTILTIFLLSFDSWAMSYQISEITSTNGRCTQGTGFVDRSILNAINQLDGLRCVVHPEAAETQDLAVSGIERSFTCFQNGVEVVLYCNESGYLFADLESYSVVIL